MPRRVERAAPNASCRSSCPAVPRHTRFHYCLSHTRHAIRALRLNPLHLCTSAPLHLCIPSPLHLCTPAPLHPCTPAPLRSFLTLNLITSRLNAAAIFVLGVQRPTRHNTVTVYSTVTEPGGEGGGESVCEE